MLRCAYRSLARITPPRTRVSRSRECLEPRVCHGFRLLNIAPGRGRANENFPRSSFAIIIDERTPCQADPADLVYSKKAGPPLLAACCDAKSLPLAIPNYPRLPLAAHRLILGAAFLGLVLA